MESLQEQQEVLRIGEERRVKKMAAGFKAKLGGFLLMFPPAT